MIRPWPQTVLSCTVALLAGLAPACFDWDAYQPPAGTTSTSGEGLQGGGGEGGAGGSVGGAGGSQPECTGDEFTCLSDGTARQCVEGGWLSLGPCPLGCDATSRACGVPSNVAPEKAGEGTGDAVVPAGGEDVTLDTDTGEILMGGSVIRPAGDGLHAGTGIAFSTVAQGTGEPGLGVFSMGSLDVEAGAVLRGVGANGLVLLVGGDVQIHGRITVATDDDTAGPGGYAGGAVGTAGDGPCAGLAGTGSYPGNNCASGGGGAGYAAPGGAGGTSTCSAPDDHGAGPGGPGTCGTATLVPLLGGSGGAGGVVAGTNPASAPQPGGGGGGALQISAGGTITVSATGELHAGGGGGGEAMESGGAGGGSGGALLLEAPVVTIATGAVLAANGGGGGAGDCN